MNKLKSDTSKKFTHIFNVPFIITDQNFLSRRKTYEVFTKDAYLELYYLQLKKARVNHFSK